ncbi:hypothetical protein DT73_02410 [Mangrovibacter sp. MFB070]|uniref:MaoC/PaaZ C-terminal domain-containing protein n=1 Tax=Mangrovibacter sp. MFB070 TaxID=1224318 RepID=UPI0004D458B3|nr:MaoC/PaaZ C-terminal domain-containing protein [Mangrovibacter sp. MFB070]KEA54244.1 hypothetical protein DT73_02410 [Mangrovibacter sp. MFB070]
MNTCCFTRQQNQSWAHFSGDYNAIHFELAAAQKAGQPALLVHGMRAILDLQQRISVPAPGLQNALLQFSARLRAPVLCDALYQIEAEHGKALLIHQESGEKCLQSRLGIACQVAAPSPVFRQEIPQSQLAALQHEWPQDLSCQPWAFLAGVLFRQQLHTPWHFPFLTDTPQDLPAPLTRLFSTATVVHTHQDITFPARLYTGELPLHSGLQLISDHPLLMGSAQSGWVIQNTLHATQQGELAMQIRTTLKATTST